MCLEAERIEAAAVTGTLPPEHSVLTARIRLAH